MYVSLVTVIHSWVMAFKLPALHGLDVKAGLATTMDNEPLYTRMLIKFRDSQAHFGALFAAAQQDVDPTAPTRCAHTLKGTAGNIGARGVQSAAEALETACKEGKSAGEIQTLLSRTLAELEPVIVALQSVASGETGAIAQASGLPARQISAALDRLKYLLEQGDTDAADFAVGLSGRMASGPVASLLKSVADAVADCDFDLALERFQQVRATTA